MFVLIYGALNPMLYLCANVCVCVCECVCVCVCGVGGGVEIKERLPEM